MAAGMHSAATGHLGSSYNKKGATSDLDVMGALEQGELVEIVALDDDTSQRAVRILQERRLQSHPMYTYGRIVKCNECGEPSSGGPDHEQDNLKHKNPKASNSIMRMAKQLMPFLTWLPQINRHTLRADIIAGLTVGVMVIPQSMSYANIAGLQYIYGMYSACVPTFIYALFGQSRQLAVGPVAMVSLLVEAGLRGQLSEEQCPDWYEHKDGREQYEVCPEQYAQLAFLTSAAVGVMQLLASVLKLGFLVSFLGHPVTSGFTSGAAVIIGLSQLKYMLGFDVPKSQFVYETIGNTVEDIAKTKPMTLCLGIAWLAFLIVNKTLSRKYKKLSLMGPLGPLISCAVGTLLIWLCKPLREEFNISYVKEVPKGMIPFSLLDLPFESFPNILPTALTACLIGYMESIAIGKNLAAKHGYEIEPGQELFALGMSNLVGSFFSCYPVTGSFSRSAVNNSTGALTQLSGFITSIVMFCTLMFLTPLFYYLPKFALAAIVMNSVIPLVAFGEMKRLWRIKKHDFILWVVAFLGTLFLGVLMGIALAVGLSLVIVIYESVRPQISILWRIPGTTIYRNVKQESSGAFIPNVFILRIGSSMYFANASFIKDQILAYVSDLEAANPTEYIVLEMTSVVSIDSTAVHIIQDIVADFRSRNIQVAFAMVGNRVEKTMRAANLKNFIGEKWFFPTVNEAVHYCLRHQHAKRCRDKTSGSLEDQDPDNMKLSVQEEGVLMGNEIGFSNELHHAWTTVFINIVNDIPGIMSEITAAFKKNNVMIMRAQIEPTQDAEGAKHTYYVKSFKKDSKLTDWEIEIVREQLQALIDRCITKGSTAESGSRYDISNPELTPSGRTKDENESHRIQILEQALLEQTSNNASIREELRKQAKALDMLLLHAQESGKSDVHTI
mmetsp:Transcript_33713/g.62348  ORF Transcript_33713/g.62348 Transcript_33713/m.62348 type:complete len:897 (+) Transcript_33713:107-2797(+)